jgi:hypothetical protein
VCGVWCVVCGSGVGWALMCVCACAMQVPTRFKVYGKPVAEGGFGVRLAKKPQGSLTQKSVENTATRLRSSLDVPSFARSPLWADFRDDADQLHAVLAAKVAEMKADAAGAADRRNSTEMKSAKAEARLVPALLAGTPSKYATLEALLRQMSDYSVLALPEELCLELYPLSEAALTGKDPDGARRKHIERWRDGMAFKSFAVELYEAQWGSHRKLSLFIWRVPISAESRELPMNLTLHAAAVQEAQKQIPIIHGRYARQAFTQKYANIAGLGVGLLDSMYTLLTSDTQAPIDAKRRAIEMRCLEFVASCGDVELWPDLRALNGNDGSKYDDFWEEGDKLLAELESQVRTHAHTHARKRTHAYASARTRTHVCQHPHTCTPPTPTQASVNRHGQERTLAQPVSVPDFTRQVEKRLREAGKLDVPIPDPHWVAFHSSIRAVRQMASPAATRAVGQLRCRCCRRPCKRITLMGIGAMLSSGISRASSESSTHCSSRT